MFRETTYFERDKWMCSCFLHNTARATRSLETDRIRHAFAAGWPEYTLTPHLATCKRCKVVKLILKYYLGVRTIPETKPSLSDGHISSLISWNYRPIFYFVTHPYTGTQIVVGAHPARRHRRHVFYLP